MDTQTKAYFVASLNALLKGDLACRGLGICHNLNETFLDRAPEYTFSGSSTYVYSTLYKTFDYLGLNTDYPIKPPRGYDGDAKSYFYEDDLWVDRQLVERKKLIRELLKVFTLDEHSEFVASLPSPDYI